MDSVIASTANGQPEMLLNVKYRGLDVDRGRMSALELGPAIYGMGQMIGRTSRVLYGDETRVRVEVKADFEHSSFGIEFVAVSPTGELLPSLSFAELAQICAILGFGVTGTRGLLSVYRWLRGREIEHVEELGDVVTLDLDGDQLVISAEEFKALSDPAIREGFEGLVRPMKGEGVSEVEVQLEDQEPDRIEKNEVGYFSIGALPDDELTEDTSTRVVEVVGPAFREDNKWRFAEGDATYWAEITDTQFLQRVERHEVVFGKGDALRVRMLTKTSVVAGKLEYKRIIEAVLAHITPREGSQRDLLGGDDEPTDD